MGEELEQALEAARARSAGRAPAAAAPAVSAPPAEGPTLEALALDLDFARRCRGATALAASAWSRGERQGCLQALAVAIAPPPKGLPPAERVTLSACFLSRALELGVPSAELGWQRLPERWAALDAVHTADLRVIASEAERALVGRENLIRNFVDRILPTPLVFHHQARPFGALDNASFVTGLLARLLAPLADPERELALLRAAADMRAHEDRPESRAGRERVARLEQALRPLATARPPEELEQRLPAWREALAPTPELAGVLARYLPHWDAARAEAELGPLSPHAVELCAAWASAGRFADALALAQRCAGARAVRAGASAASQATRGGAARSVREISKRRPRQGQPSAVAAPASQRDGTAGVHR